MNDPFAQQRQVAQLRLQLREQPNNAEIRVVLATILWRGGAMSLGIGQSSAQARQTIKTQRAEAISLMHEALRLAENIESLNEMSQMLKAVGDNDKARQCLQRALALSPRFCRAHRNLAFLDLAEGKTASALDHLLRAIESDPADTASWTAMGRLLYDEGDVVGATDAMKAAVEVDDRNYSALLWLGEHYGEAAASSPYASPSSSSSSANSNSNNNSSAIAALGGAQTVRQRLHSAIAAMKPDIVIERLNFLKRALMAHPFHAEVFATLGRFLEQWQPADSVGRFSAIRCYRMALGCSGASLKAPLKQQLQERLSSLASAVNKNNNNQKSGAASTSSTAAIDTSPILVRSLPNHYACMRASPFSVLTTVLGDANNLNNKSSTSSTTHAASAAATVGILDVFQRDAPPLVASSQPESSSSYYWLDEAPPGARCSLGHKLLLVRSKAYFGFNSLSCDRCHFAISKESARLGVLHCPAPCDTDICPRCVDSWVGVSRRLHQHRFRLGLLMKNMFTSSVCFYGEGLVGFRGISGALTVYCVRDAGIDALIERAAAKNEAGGDDDDKKEKDIFQHLLKPTLIAPVTDSEQISFLRSLAEPSSAISSSTSSFVKIIYDTSSSSSDAEGSNNNNDKNKTQQTTSLADLQRRVRGTIALQKGLHEFEAGVIMKHVLTALNDLHEKFGVAVTTLSPTSIFVDTESAAPAAKDDSNQQQQPLTVKRVRFLALNGLVRCSGKKSQQEGRGRDHDDDDADDHHGKDDKKDGQEVIELPRIIFGDCSFHVYIAPELVPPKSAYDMRTCNVKSGDAWSAGVIWLYLITGSRPFKSVSRPSDQQKPPPLPTSASPIVSSDGDQQQQRGTPASDIGFIISCFLSIIKIGTPYNLQRIRSFTTAACVDLAVKLCDLHAEQRTSLQAILASPYFALFSADSRVGLPWRCSAMIATPSIPSTSPSMSAGMEPSADYVRRTSFRVEDLEAWSSALSNSDGSDCSFVDDALSVLHNHAFWPDSPKIAAAWLIVAASLKLERSPPEHQEHAADQQQQKHSLSSSSSLSGTMNRYRYLIKLPPHGSCENERIVAGRVIIANNNNIINNGGRGQTWLSVDKLDCLRYALASHHPIASNHNNNNNNTGSGSSSSEQAMRFLFPSLYSMSSTGSTVFNGAGEGGAGGGGGGGMGTPLPSYVSLSTTTASLSASNLGRKSINDMNSSHSHPHQQHPVLSLLLLFGGRTDALNTLAGVRKMRDDGGIFMVNSPSTATMAGAPSASAASSGGAKSPMFPAPPPDAAENHDKTSIVSFTAPNHLTVADFDVVSNHLFLLQVECTSLQQQQLLSLRQLVAAVGPLSEHDVQLIAVHILSRIHRLTIVTPDNFFVRCSVGADSITFDPTQVFAPAPFAAIVPAFVDDGEDSDHSSAAAGIAAAAAAASDLEALACRGATVEQAEPLFHVALLAVFLLTGGDAALEQMVANLLVGHSWSEAMASVLVGKVKPSISHLLQLCVSDVPPRAGDVQQRLMALLQEAEQEDDDDDDDHETNAKKEKKKERGKQRQQQQQQDQNVVVVPRVSKQKAQDININTGDSNLINNNNNKGRRGRLWLKLWTDAAQTKRRAQLESNFNTLGDVSSNAIEWLLNSGNSVDGVALKRNLLVVEGYGDTLGLSALLMSTAIGNMSQFRFYLSDPDDIRWLAQPKAAAAPAPAKPKKDKEKEKEKGAASAASAAAAAVAASSASGPALSPASPSPTGDSSPSSSSFSSTPTFSMLRILQEQTLESADALLETLNRIGGVKTEVLAQLSFVFVRDCDLKVCGPVKNLGSVPTRNSTTSYSHRLRFGRAIENYVVFPYYVPISILQSDLQNSTKACFTLLLAAFANIATLYFPTAASNSKDAVMLTRPGEGWMSWVDGPVTIGRAGGAGSQPLAAAAAAAATPGDSGSGGGLPRIFAQQLVKNHLLRTQFDQEALTAVWKWFLMGSDDGELAESLAGLYESSGQQQQQQQPLLQPKAGLPDQMHKELSPKDKALASESLVWPLLPQFASRIASRLSQELRLFQQQSSSPSSVANNFEDWAEEQRRKAAEQPKSVPAAAAATSKNASAATASSSPTTSCAFLPRLVRAVLRSILHRIHRGIWSMHLGEVSSKLVNFGVEKFFSTTSSSTCPGLLLGLSASYTPRKMFAAGLPGGGESASAKSVAAGNNSEECLDSLCLHCAQPVREHDARFTSTTTAGANPNSEDDELHLFLDALCLFSSFSFDSHYYCKLRHGGEGCLGEHLELYPNIPHHESPGAELDWGRATPETRKCRDELQLREEVHAEHIGVALGGGFCCEQGALSPLFAASCVACKKNAEDAGRFLLAAARQSKKNSAAAAATSSTSPSTANELVDGEACVRAFLTQSEGAKKLLEWRVKEMMQLTAAIRNFVTTI